MILQTNIALRPEQKQIDYNSKVLLIGSCFVENIGDKLEYFKFQNLQNPFGIIFHPVAISGLVLRAVNEVFFTEEDIFFHNDQWHCFETHSSLNGPDKGELLRTLNKKLKEFREYLLSATHIIFTYGTAWVYRYIKTKKIVANCHKVPQQQFSKELLNVELVSESIQDTIAAIEAQNQNAVFITTVSPIRHIKDGFAENMQSKAHLITGLHKALENFHDAYYFPSYEIMMDELRDYRFYMEDMLHPNRTAISIIWKRFQDVWIASETEPLQKEIDHIQKGLQHRPFNPSGQAHQDFQKALQQQIAALRKKLPHITFQE